MQVVLVLSGGKSWCKDDLEVLSTAWSLASGTWYLETLAPTGQEVTSAGLEFPCGRKNRERGIGEKRGCCPGHSMGCGGQGTDSWLSED